MCSKSVPSLQLLEKYGFPAESQVRLTHSLKPNGSRFHSNVQQGAIGTVKFVFDGRMIVDFDGYDLKFTKAERETCLERISL